MVNKLRMKGATIKENEAVDMMLASLPAVYDPIISVLTTETEINWEKARERLISFNARLKLREEGEEQVHFTKAGNRNNQNTGCYRCGKTGHIARNCRGKGEDKREQRHEETRCFRCEKSGHIARYCRVKISEDEMRRREQQDKGQRDQGGRELSMMAVIGEKLKDKPRECAYCMGEKQRKQRSEQPRQEQETRRTGPKRRANSPRGGTTKPRKNSKSPQGHREPEGMSKQEITEMKREIKEIMERLKREDEERRKKEERKDSENKSENNENENKKKKKEKNVNEDKEEEKEKKQEKGKNDTANENSNNERDERHLNKDEDWERESEQQGWEIGLGFHQETKQWDDDEFYEEHAAEVKKECEKAEEHWGQVGYKRAQEAKKAEKKRSSGGSRSSPQRTM